MQKKITTFLTYDGQAEEAANLYTSVFPNSKITSTRRYGAAGPGEEGSMMTATFELDGQEFMALNGGPSFTFGQGFSLFVDCETQEEVDQLWEKLSEGGEKGQCGWLTDKFGVSWQIIPSALGELLGDEDPREGEPGHERDAADGQDRDRKPEEGVRVFRRLSTARSERRGAAPLGGPLLVQMIRPQRLLFAEHVVTFLRAPG